MIAPSHWLRTGRRPRPIDLTGAKVTIEGKELGTVIQGSVETAPGMISPSMIMTCGCCGLDYFKVMRQCPYCWAIE
jgi:hypothetical protein